MTELSAVGFEQSEKNLLDYFKEEKFRSYEVNKTIKTYLFYITIIKEQNWNEAWEKAFQPVIVDGFCAIRAYFHAPISNVQHELIITPKMSFGTGHHATTHMMVQHMREIKFKDKTVFDFGTGTGVLAVLAEKLGAASVYAIDNDEWSIRNANENRSINGCNRLEIAFASSVPKDKSFDVILANINRNVILMHLESIAGALAKEGLLLISGFLETNVPELADACNRLQLNFIKQKSEDGWTSMLFNKGC